MNTNYFDTFITVAGDYSGDAAKAPAERGGRRTVALMQYDMMIDAPYEHTQEDVLFGVWLARQELGDLADDEVAALRSAFFAKGQPCLRASPLTKTHGWGVHFDGQGRAALVALESPEYTDWVEEPSITVLAAMRSKRA